MNFPQINKPSKLSLDKSTKYLSPEESFYLLNHDVTNVLGKATPIAANFLACDMDVPAGETYSVGEYYSPLTNEAYSWVYNSNGVHYIQRINGDGECQVVYYGDCLIVNADPKHDIRDWRAYMKVDRLCANQHGKQLIWVDGTDTPIGQLDVEASIATNSFTTPFFDVCPNDCAALQMCVPNPDGCLVGNFVPFNDADKGLSNNILDIGFKFMYQHVYYDRRASEWSDRSSLYYQDTKACFFEGDGLPRCIKFRLPIGNPLVDKINFAVSEDGGVTWYLYDTIEKYKKYNSTQQYWYERQLSELVQATFSDADCAFDYTFCNDKQKLALAPVSVSRVANPMPREVQGLFPIKDSLGFYNYKIGSCPIDKIEIDKFTISKDCTPSTVCTTEFAKVTVRAIVYATGTLDFPFGYVYKTTGVEGSVDDLTGIARFGFAAIGGFQEFGGTARNFIPYIEGTDYWGEMEQWTSTPYFTTRSKVGLFSGIDNSFSADSGYNGWEINFQYQEYIFNVPKGTKGFIRMASHRSSSGAGDNKNKSTQVIGTLGVDGLKSIFGTNTLTGLDDTPKEIYFDTCNGDVDNFDAFVIGNFIPEANSLIYSGYVSDKDGAPVEGARILCDALYKATTDWNGFYSFWVTASTVTISVEVEQNCDTSFTTIQTTGSAPENTSSGIGDVAIQSDSYTNTEYYALVNIQVKDCNDQGVKGVRISISGSKYKITDTDGIAHFKLRNYNNRDREIVGVVMDNGTCFSLDCNGNCNPCLPSTPSTLLGACFYTIPEYNILLSTQINRNIVSLTNRGLKQGGVYQMGWVAEGDCGRLSAVNTISNPDGYFTMPKIQEIGSLSFCHFNYDAGGINLPLWVNRIKIVRSVNLKPFTIQWVVDEIDRSVNGKIKITIQSLNDYNTQYNFKTNTVYKYAVGDRIEFIQNGDGIVFDVATNGILNYAILSPFNDDVLSGVTDDVNYFNQLIIIDDGKLSDLKKGAKIEIQPASSINEEPAFFEICASITVTNGEVDIQTGSFSTFDTYLVKRQIGKFAAQLFESKTPSDFWGGTSLDDTGKVHFINRYENERRYGRNITINSATQFNYFGDFIKTLDAALQGDIIAISIKDDKIGLAICQFDNFLFQISDQLLRVGSDNVIRATTADNIISNPDVKISGQYGCEYSDIGSIFFGDGYVTYADSNNDTYIIHDYSIANIAGSRIENGKVVTDMASFFRKRLREKSAFNKNATNVLDNYRFSTGINKNNGVVYLTLKSLRHAGVNNEKAPYLAPNDTIIYNPATNNFLGFTSFTPEGYSKLDLNTDEGCAFLCYQNSLPYIHPTIATKYNEFFGIACDWVIGVSVNKFPEKQKIPFSIEEQSDKMFFVSKVTTDNDSFISEIPAIRFKKNGEKWNGAFLKNVNSRGGLYNGNPARGYQIDVVFIKDNTINNGYGTIDNNKRTEYNELDQILFKFMLSEQSGFINNL